MFTASENNFSVHRLSLHKAHHRNSVWMHYANFFIGIWLVADPSTFDYSEGIISINNIICGVLISMFSLLSVNPMRLWAPWAVAFIGLWLNVSPIILWAGQAEVFSSNTLFGLLVMVFAVLAPGVPGYKLYEENGPDIPPGWSVNPSSWQQRVPIITIGWLGFFASRYLASYQLGYKSELPDPFFGKGTENVLNSEVSQSWPVSDAGLGAFSYLLDAMMGYLGGENRWRTLPWTVILFGILIIPLGAVSIGLIILQPVAVGSWCSLCLFTALAMLIMIPCTFDEVFASIYVLKENKKKGKPFWRTFFLGGTVEGESKTFEKHDLTKSPASLIREIFSDFTVPLNLVASGVLGIWLMFSPALFGYSGAMADNDHTAGALVVTFSVIAMGEIVRTIRFINVLSGIWIALAPVIIFTQPVQYAMINGIATGVVIALLSLRKGKQTNSYGTFDRYIF